MAEEKVWAKEFLEYEEFIANHPNYKGLPITKGKDGKPDSVFRMENTKAALDYWAAHMTSEAILQE